MNTISETNKNYLNPNFKGLSKALSKNIFRDITIENLDKAYPKSDGIVGNLPYVWIKNIPKNERKNTVKSLYKTLGKFIGEDFSCYHLDKTTPGIEKILKEHKVIKPDSKINIEFVGEGAFSHGFVIENPNEHYSLFLKKFRCRIYDEPTHGPVAENNRKIYFKKNIKQKSEKKMLSNFYFGDLKNRYYIEEFLDNENCVQVGNSIIKNLKIKFQNILMKHHAYHGDLNDSNYKVCKKTGDTFIRCYDMGGIRKYK